MIIAVLSDTHIPTRAKELPKKLVERLEQVDLILHAGDFVHRQVYEMLAGMKKIEAVAGNMDEDDLKIKLPSKKIIQAGEVRIGLVHGCGIPWDLIHRVPANFTKEKLNCIVYGHTHIPRNEVIDGRLYFNPGSPTDTIFSTANTFGILEINGTDIKAEIVKI
ncbi:YfcE family phosphodiesterase [Candidatus Desantisbacteria bacterium CG_4_10_14_0_8_um_filter_48_22]|uniref:Phosphoesterase n=1 Tax=Candidatus Desantisbacteria bacterium CG_4_10_14_0_8_um_filter_48_22 TaxID=1974543 RepID=A0A2M7SAH4_9BACT|nr:MAG: hypothetical protein AUJ67_06795 [Candidatus Desantisbacteria bacterium CG1_02_49_89]PIV56361.1 MAG: YfcE family phosphodiesterase [Candidatus Desantisbacteria bacterium CG02_land_8_20_14_3_00_49_13]PIZ16534.1 MAG: YfcE family phosphodiesterase [Candidatus Desantisbacteria bacterium CG_4_10_14_0_8_um_filter_48_22]PJB27795.1 MAG: YfcE family phosphodiesterase [Candidatus Desantisbacteria bacterium CG_4_9_14_3_um_filter_50_7]